MNTLTPAFNLGQRVTHRSLGAGAVTSPLMAGGTVVRVLFDSGLEPLVCTADLKLRDAR